jgi:hypothetical protein
MSKEHFWKIDWKPIESSSNVIWPIQKDHFWNFTIKENDLWLDPKQLQDEIDAYKAPFLEKIKESFTWMKEILASVNWGMITNPDKRFNESIKLEDDKIIVVSDEVTYTYTMKDGHIVMTKQVNWNKEREMTVISDMARTIKSAYNILQEWVWQKNW